MALCSCSLQHEHLGALRSFTPPLFLFSAGKAILVLVIAHETKPTWYSSLGSSPVGTPLIQVGASRTAPFCVVFRLSGIAQALSAGSWVFMCRCVCFVCISYVRFLQSRPYASVADLDVINLPLAFPGPTFVDPPLRRTYSISS